MFGWLKAAVMRASSRNMRSKDSLLRTSGRIRLMATYLRKPPGPAVKPRNSSAMPPTESWVMIWYLPICSPR